VINNLINRFERPGCKIKLNGKNYWAELDFKADHSWLTKHIVKELKIKKISEHKVLIKLAEGEVLSLRDIVTVKLKVMNIVKEFKYLFKVLKESNQDFD
jgi:hypothetical protein